MNKDNIIVRADTPLRLNIPLEACVARLRDQAPEKKKAELMRNLAAGGAILSEAGLLRMVLSLGEIEGITPRMAIEMALKNIPDQVHSVSSTEQSVSSRTINSSEQALPMENKKQRPVIGKLR